MLKRVMDLMLAFLATILLFPIIVLVGLAVRSTSPGPIFYWSQRVGKDSKLFPMPKFRTMRVNTPEVATHLLRDPSLYLTPIGSFLRKTSLDELPQLISIWSGYMSFVGPRPALFNQYDLISMRKMHGVDIILPGLTGWAQINGRDDLEIASKVELDKFYLQKKSILFDFKILLLTILKVTKGDGVSH